MLRRVCKFIFKTLAIVAGTFIFFYGIFFYLIEYHTKISTSDTITNYQYKDLTILYISSCVTTLALVVALLKDEIRSIWLKAKIVVTPKFPNFIYEKPLENPGAAVDKRTEYYYVVLNVINTGSLHINLCSISLTGLQYKAIHGDPIDIDISLSEEIKWIGKSVVSTPIHPNGGKAEAMVIQIKINDAGTPGESKSQQAKLFIGGIEATKGHPPSNGSQWIATFMIYYDQSRPVEYKLEISWDGQWQHRLPEMLEHSKIKVV